MAVAFGAHERRFLGGLPRRIERVSDWVERLARTPDDVDTLELLENELHQLAGTASTFGFAEVAQAARTFCVWAHGRSRADRPSELGDARRLVERLVLAATPLTFERDAIDSADAPTPRPAAHAKLQVVLIDDDPDIRILVATLLAEAGGFAVRTYPDVDAVLGREARVAPADLVLLDVHLGERSGREALPEVARAFGPAARVAFLTAPVGHGAITELRALGVVDVIEKPFDPVSLADKVRALAVAPRARSVEGSCSPESSTADRDAAWLAAVVEPSRLMQSLAHHVRNPVAALQSIVEGASVGEPSSSRVRPREDMLALLRRIDRALVACVELTRPKSIPRRRQGIGALLDHVTRTFRRRAPNVVFEVSVDPRLASATDLLVSGDAIVSILDEIVENAADAGASRVTISTRLHTNIVGSRTLLVDVRDDGAGVPEGNADLVFEPFFSTRAHRVGLGLTIARKLALDLSGDVALTRDAGATLFSVRLPTD